MKSAAAAAAASVSTSPPTRTGGLAKNDVKQGKPPVFDPDKSQWTEFDHKWKADLGMMEKEYLYIIELVVADPTKEIEMTQLNQFQQQAAADLYYSLVMLTSGGAASIVQMVSGRDGLEAYRLLKKRYDPSTLGRSLAR